MSQPPSRLAWSHVCPVCCPSPQCHLSCGTNPASCVGPYRAPCMARRCWGAVKPLLVLLRAPGSCLSPSYTPLQTHTARGCLKPPPAIRAAMLSEAFPRATRDTNAEQGAAHYAWNVYGSQHRKYFKGWSDSVANLYQAPLALTALPSAVQAKAPYFHLGAITIPN